MCRCSENGTGCKSVITGETGATSVLGHMHGSPEEMTFRGDLRNKQTQPHEGPGAGGEVAGDEKGPWEFGEAGRMRRMKENGRQEWVPCEDSGLYPKGKGKTLYVVMCVWQDYSGGCGILARGQARYALVHLSCCDRT